jgi:hypothetical protein
MKPRGCSIFWQVIDAVSGPSASASGATLMATLELPVLTYYLPTDTYLRQGTLAIDPEAPSFNQLLPPSK